MKLIGLRIRPIHFKLTLPLLAVWLVSLAWSVNHHVENQRYRLGYLAKGVQQVARYNAVRINVGEAARITCEAAAARGSTGGGSSGGGIFGGGCGRPDAVSGVVACGFSEACDFRYAAENRRLRAALEEALKDLQYLPYFSETYQERVLGRGEADKEFHFRVELHRLLPGGAFVQVSAIGVPARDNPLTFGLPVAQYAASPPALARATAAWDSGEMSELVTPEAYQLFWPLKDPLINGGRTAALLTIEVERERPSPLYVAGLVTMLSFWFIVLGMITAVSSVFLGVALLFNAVPVWVTGLLLLALLLLGIYFRERLARLGRFLPGLTTKIPPAKQGR